jgi:hypothetical protein
MHTQIQGCIDLKKKKEEGKGENITYGKYCHEYIEGSRH